MSVLETIMAKLQHLSVEEQERVLDSINKLPSADKGAFAAPTSPNGLAAQATIWTKLQAIGQASENENTELPPDLAANHDFYLHRLPLRT